MQYFVFLWAACGADGRVAAVAVGLAAEFAATWVQESGLTVLGKLLGSRDSATALGAAACIQELLCERQRSGTHGSCSWRRAGASSSQLMCTALYCIALRCVALRRATAYPQLPLAIVQQVGLHRLQAAARSSVLPFSRYASSVLQTLEQLAGRPSHPQHDAALWAALHSAAV